MGNSIHSFNTYSMELAQNIRCTVMNRINWHKAGDKSLVRQINIIILIKGKRRRKYLERPVKKFVQIM